MDPIQEIKDKLDIVEIVRSYIPLMPAGKNLKANCPFHKEKSPSFIVSPERQTWHCFGSCNEGGDVISFVMKYENVEFYEALGMLAQKAGVELKRISPSNQKEFGVLYDINAAAKDFFVQQRESDKRALEYLTERGLKKETIDEFEIGYSSQGVDALIINLVNAGYDVVDIERAGLAFKTERKTYMDRFRGRIMFPICNTFGKVIGFSGRILPELDNGEMGKYVNSPETAIFNKSRALYGFHATKHFIKESGCAILVEGQMDFLMLYQDGVKNIVATSGTAFTQPHLEILKKYADRLILGFDSDEAGLIAAERSIDMAHTIDMSVSVFTISGAKDAAEYIQKNPGSIKHLVDSQSVGALDFYYNRYLKGVSEGDIKTKLRHVLEKVVRVASPLDQNQMLKKLSEKVGVSENVLLDELSYIKKKRVVATQKNEATSGKTPQKIDLPTRSDNIAMELLILSFFDKTEFKKLFDIKTFLPQRFVDAVDFLQDGTKDKSEGAEIARYAEMKSSLRADLIDDKRLPLVVNDLIRDIKKEYYKEKQNEVLARIKKLKQSGQIEEEAKLLKEFDEITKLVNN